MILSLALVLSARVQDSPVALFNSFIAALNKVDKAAMTRFVTEKATSNVPVEDRVSLLMDLASQGAPFKVEGEPKVVDDSVSATVSDKQGIRLDFKMMFTARPLKMSGVQVQMSRTPDASLNDWKDLPGLAESVRDKLKVPGVSLTVFRDGKFETAVAGVREAGKDAKIEADDPLSIGSIGKPLCTTIIGILIDQGKLKWDQTLKESLPDIAMKPDYVKATLEQIMHHRGGIPADNNFTRAMVEKIVGDAKDPIAIRKNYVTDILSREPLGEPGKVYEYSNAGFAILGHIAERVTGKPYETLVKELIFEPLGLKHSFTGSDTLPKDHPVGHVPGPDGLRAVNFGGPIEILAAPAGGGIWMSTADLCRFGQEHLKGLNGKDGILKADTVKRLHTGEKEPEGDLVYACGWGIESFPGVETFHGHNGSNGTMRAQLCVFPKAGLVVTCIVNSGGEIGMSPGLQAALAIASRYAKGQ